VDPRKEDVPLVLTVYLDCVLRLASNLVIPCVSEWTLLQDQWAQWGMGAVKEPNANPTSQLERLPQRQQTGTASILIPLP